MKIGDLIWGVALVIVSSFLLFPVTREIFVQVTKEFPYAMGFVKVAVLATMGELLALRIIAGKWRTPPGIVYRMIIWGILGMSFVITFDVYANGVAASAKKGLLFAGGAYSGIMTAFWTSVIANLTFAPTMMAFHRITDTCIDLADGRFDKFGSISLRQVVNQIDWYGFVGFVICRTIPFFWVPAHTITFLLPPEYRVLMAAFLSIALGAILAFAKRAKKPEMTSA